MITRKLGILFIFFIFIFTSLKAQNNSAFEIFNKHISLKSSALSYYKKNLPAVVDNSQEQFFPPIYHQTHWVCNQVSASYYMLTYEMCRIRNLNASNTNNQFSVYYPWNWSHGGYGWYGGAVSTTLNIAKNCGIPLINQSPADNTKDSSLWISGYDKYYSFMKNRISDYYFIDVSTEEGLLALKAWIYDHGRNERPGGLATFMANIALGGSGLFPAGSPEAGNFVMTKCGTDPTHARTVVGYNDNVRWDYNGDGQYTNNIDINGDGIVDVRDWEIGGFKLAESYGPNWQQNGFMYIMYKAVADNFPNGGILNNEMMVFEAINNYSPLLTAKVKLHHVNRGNIKISIGLSTNPNATKPDIEIDFPIVNYQGGDKFMQGGTSEDNKSIELGFDITPLLSYINPNEENKFFVIGRERDTHNEYEGAITNFSIFLHTTNPVYSTHWSGNVEFNGNVVYVPLSLNIPFSKPHITNESLPIFNNNCNFNYYMNAIGGKQPYKWFLESIIDTITTNQNFEIFSDIKLTPNYEFDGVVDYDLKFDFPFNNTNYSHIKISTDGYIMLGDKHYPWTYIHDYMDDFFKMEKIIAPHVRYNFVANPNYGDGIWVKEGDDYVSIRWNVSQKYSEPWTDCNFSVTLRKNGDIDFLYGNQSYNKTFTGFAGMSFGDNLNYVFSAKNDIDLKNKKITFKSYPSLNNLNISNNGKLSGNLSLDTPYPIRIVLKDADNLICKKEYFVETGIIENKNDQVKVYPNPSFNNLNIELPEGAFFNSIQFFDLSGKELDVSYFYLQHNRIVVDISNFISGNYTVKIVSNQNFYIRNFIKL